MDILKQRSLIAKGSTIYDIPMRVTYYARVSTDKYEQKNSLKNQKGHYSDMIKENPRWTYIEGYVDEGISGTSIRHRDNFIKMIDDAKSGKFDFILTKEISRFARNTLDSIFYTRELLSSGVAVFFQDDGINTLDNDSELRLTIMASLAQDEVRKTSEREHFGFERAQRNGVILGRDNLFGYQKIKNGYKIIESEAEVVRRIFNEYVEGKNGLKRIAIELKEEGIKGKSGGDFCYATIANMIKNPKYKGYYAGHKSTAVDYLTHKRILFPQGDWIIHKDERIPPIIDESTWDKANAIMKQRGKTMKEHAKACQNRYSYSGKIFCGEHGTTYHRHVYHSNRRGDTECWNCSLYRLRGKKDGCDSPTIYSRELDSILSEIYKDININKDKIIDEIIRDFSEVTSKECSDSDLKKLDEKCLQIKAKKDKLLELSISGCLSDREFKERNDEFNDQLSKLESSIESIKETIKSNSDMEGQISKIKSALDKQWSSSGAYTNEISSIMLDKIVVNKNPDKLHLKLDVYLKFGSPYQAIIDKIPDQKNSIISVVDTGISQAQVSRLEKNAISRIKKSI